MAIRAWTLGFILQNWYGPGVEPPCVCYHDADLDQDGDIDLADFAEFQNKSFSCEFPIDDEGNTDCAFYYRVDKEKAND